MSSTLIDELLKAQDYRNGEGSYNRLMDKNDDDMIEVKPNEGKKIANIQELLAKSLEANASDIHISAGAPPKYRIDGKLKPLTTYEVMTPEVTKRILQEVMSAEQIEEFEKTGDLDFAIGVKDVGRFRVNVYKQRNSYAGVFRLLSNTIPSAHDLRLPQSVIDMCNLKRGIVLVTGPTGSGKSTTLYTALSELNTEKVNISTIEDPVEADIDGINQVQVNEKSGVTFPSALRCFLRQDPDIIMVGEIRDTETASLAIDASLTGHLVVSTLHTNSSVSSISRLEKMGIEPYLLADATVGILAQRLVKRLCTCKKQKRVTIRDRKKLGIGKEEEITLYEPCGCVKCNGTGYKGRIAVYEILVFTEELKEAIADERPLNEIEDIAMKQGLQTLKMSTIKLIKQSITTVEELDRIVHEPDIEMDLEEENNE